MSDQDPRILIHVSRPRFYPSHWIWWRKVSQRRRRPRVWALMNINSNSLIFAESPKINSHFRHSTYKRMWSLEWIDIQRVTEASVSPHDVEKRVVAKITAHRHNATRHDTTSPHTNESTFFLPLEASKRNRLRSMYQNRLLVGGLCKPCCIFQTVVIGTNRHFIPHIYQYIHVTILIHLFIYFNPTDYIISDLYASSSSFQFIMFSDVSRLLHDCLVLSLLIHTRRKFLGSALGSCDPNSSGHIVSQAFWETHWQFLEYWSPLSSPPQSSHDPGKYSVSVFCLHFRCIVRPGFSRPTCSRVSSCFGTETKDHRSKKRMVLGVRWGRTLALVLAWLDPRLRHRERAPGIRPGEGC